MVRPSESIAETQPKLHPATLAQRPHPIRDLSPKNERKTFLIDNPTTAADFAALLS
jgi:hypothetical protein